MSEPTSETTHFGTSRDIEKDPRQAEIDQNIEWIRGLQANVESGGMTQEDFFKKIAALLADRDYTTLRTQEKATRTEAELRTDTLTGLGNKIKFDEDVALLEKFKDDYALLIGDLDGFREINNTFGHAEGDSAIRQFAKRLAELANRKNPTNEGSPEVEAYRLHGDETAIVIRGKISPAGLKELGDYFVRGIHGEIMDIGHTKRRVTTSFGGAVRNYSEETDQDSFINSVDKLALYRAKDLGKNQSYILGHDNIPTKNR